MKLLNVLKKSVALLVVLCILFVLCSCNSSNKFVGNWVCEKSYGSRYPDQMTLQSDGTGTADGYPCSWAENDGTLTLNVGNAFIGSLSYEYRFEGSTLYLDDFAYDKN